MAFNTGNAVGSTDPRDLSDNSENFDRAVNNTASATWTDRLGKTRTSLAGQIGYIGTGTGGAIEDYAVGQELSGYNVIIRYNGEFYRPSASATLPYTTAATTPDADPNLVSIGDANLRQDLSNNTASLGSDLLAHTGTSDTVTQALNKRTIYVGSVAELEALPSPITDQEAMVSGTPFKYDGTDWQLSGGFVYVESFGASPDSADNTSAYDALIAWVPSGTEVIWSKPGATYIGNFQSPTKSLRCNLNGAILTDFTNDPICTIGSLSNVVEYDVTETSIGYGRKTFTVVGASSQFSVGDIGYLWDQAVRPTGGDVNFETVKIKSISTDTITVVGYIASFKGASGIKFYHDPNQLKGGEIFGGDIVPSATHGATVSGIFNSDGVRIEDLETRNTSGPATSVRYCWDLTAKDIRINDPRETTSGRGYGLELLGVSHYYVRNIKGRGCRHVYDQDSVYFGDIEGLEDMEAASAPVTLAHNGFSSEFTCRGITCSSDTYPAQFSEQGYGGTISADKNRHPFRNVKIEDVNVSVPTKSPNDFNVAGVYFQNTIIDSHVDNVRAFYENEVTVTSGANSSIVRVDGIVIGNSSFSRLSANLAGRAVMLEDEGSWGYQAGTLKVRDVRLGESDRPVWARGRHIVNVDNVTCETAPVGGSVVTLTTVSGRVPLGVYAGHDIDPGQISSAVAVDSDAYDLKGHIPSFGWLSSTSVPVTAGQALTRMDVQLRSRFVRILPPTGTGTTSLSATDALPPAITDSEEMWIAQPATGRDTAEFPAGNNIIATFTIADQEWVRLTGENGKWRMTARGSLA